MSTPARCRIVRSRAWLLPLGLALAAPPAVAAPPQPAPAVSEARSLFADALADEDAGRWSAALLKYRRVQATRDTSPVRFRIALCTMKLGHLSDGRALFLQTVDGTQVPSAEDSNVGAASREAAAELATHLGYVRLDGPATQGNEKLVRLDGQSWSGAGMREVDPGAHVLLVQADDGSAREVPFTVGAQETRTVRLFDGVGSRRAAAPSGPWTRAVHPAHEPLPRWPAILGLAAGGALVVTGAVALGVRQSHVHSVLERCPGGICAAADRAYVDDQRTKASTLRATGAVTISLGVAAAAFGAVWLFLGRRPHDARVSWSIAPQRGGGQAAVGLAF